MGLKFEPGHWYTEAQLRIAGLDGDVIRGAMGGGRLRYKMAEGEPVFRGEWLLAWLDGLPEPEAAEGAKK